MSHSEKVCVIDDDMHVCRLACQILEQRGIRTRQYYTAEAFLADFSPEDTVCVITDLRLPTIDGAELQRRLLEIERDISIVVLTGHADVSTAVRLMEAGAVTLLEKPFDGDQLVEMVEQAIELTRKRRARSKEQLDTQAGLSGLTENERKVLDGLMKSVTNKEIASQLDVSLRTIDRMRNSILAKFGAQSVAELVLKVAKLASTGGS